MLPQFLCIGAQKAGTSWLFANLNQHPSIWMPPIKELHFFDHLFVPENRRWTMGHLRKGAVEAIRWHLNKSMSTDFAYLKYLSEIVTEDPFTEGWYRRVYDRPSAQNRMLGDITPEYSTIPEQGIRYVRQVLGAVKLIYIIRDPVSRAMSQVRMNLERTGYSPASDEDWKNVIMAEEIGNRGDYMQYIPQWLSTFAAKDIMFIPYRAIGENPRQVLTEVENFLGIETNNQYPQAETVVHKSKKIDIPPLVMNMLSESMLPQREFLVRQFGTEFVNNI